jgi:hypothetical protein
MKRMFTFSLWKLINIDEVNSVIDDAMGSKGTASDISYRCKKVSASGDLTVEADFTLEDPMK